MSYWNTLPPTTKQLTAVEAYNSMYGVKIKISSKQDAHDIISTFCTFQKLEFNNTYIEGTTIGYKVVDINKFKQYKEINYNNLKNVVSFTVENGIATFLMKNQNQSPTHLLSALSRNVDRLTTEPSMSEYEDSLGYLDEAGLKEEANLYGSNPMWWE